MRTRPRAVDGRVLDVTLARTFFGDGTYRVMILGRGGRNSDISIDAGGEIVDVRKR